MIDKNILHIDGAKKFDNIIDKWKQTKDKDIVYIKNDDEKGTRKFDIYEIFKNYLNKGIDYKKIKEIINNIKKAVESYQKK